MRVRAPRRACAVLLTILPIFVAGVAHAANPADRFGRAIEPYPVYAGQTTCSPTVKPGTRKLAAWLMRTYPGTGSSGIVRACGAGGTSEHKEGRAFDWRVNYYNTRQRAQAEHFLRQLTATDRHGNKYALARRMGVMYAIWDNRIFSMTGPGWKPYRGASPHRDHVHISLNWQGARGLTSFYDGTVHTPAPEMLRPAPGPPSRPIPPVIDQRKTPEAVLKVRSSGAMRRSTFSLHSSRTYRLVATGLYRYGTESLQVADPMCAWAPEDHRGWAPGAREGLRPPPLTVDGVAGWRPRSGSGCDRNHTYVWDYRPAVTGPITLRLPDRFAEDNVGAVTVRVLRARAATAAIRAPRTPPLPATPAAEPEASLDGWTVVNETVTVPADDRAGVRTTGVLTAGVPYEIVARGTYDHGHGEADAECSSRKDSPEWRRWSGTHPRHPGADTLDLYIDGTDLSGSPSGDDDEADCDETGHSYRSWYVPSRTGRATLAVWDPRPSDNRGSLTVQIRRAGWPQRPARGAVLTDGKPLSVESVFVTGDDPAGVLTLGVLQAGARYRLHVSGRWSYGAGEADAECSTAPGRTEWRRRAADHGFGEDLFDLHLDGRDVGFSPVGPSSGNCALNGTYTVEYRPKHTGRLRLGLWGLESRDASGGVTVDIKRV